MGGAEHHGRRAVAQAVHLVESAGLEARRHQEAVGTGLDAVGQGFDEAEADGDLAGVASGELAEPGF